MQGEVERRVREHVHVGQRLATPAQGKPFVVADMTSDALVLDLAEKWRTPIPWTCLEGVVPFICARRSVLIGSKYETEGAEGTLDGYLKAFVNRATAGWVAAVLEVAGVVEIDRTNIWPNASRNPSCCTCKSMRRNCSPSDTNPDTERLTRSCAATSRRSLWRGSGQEVALRPSSLRRRWSDSASW